MRRWPSWEPRLEAERDVDGQSMLVTVAICTWNRAALLRATLEQMTRLEVPAGLNWELVVVNNNCSDETDTVLRAFADSLPIRRLYEPRLGLSHARNTAVREAVGEYIIWTDDDVLVDEQWLAEYHNAFKRYPEAAVFGGPIAPLFPTPPPEWLRRAWPQISRYYAIRDCPNGGSGGSGAGPRPIAPNYIPYGANLSLRMDVQARYPYDPRLGRRGSRLFSGEEWAVVTAILKEGGTGWWIPRAFVRHYLPRERLTAKHLRGVIRRHGEIRARRAASESQSAQLLRRRLRLWAKTLKAELRYRMHRVISPPDVWIRHLIDASFLRGRLFGYSKRPV